MYRLEQLVLFSVYGFIGTNGLDHVNPKALIRNSIFCLGRIAQLVGA